MIESAASFTKRADSRYRRIGTEGIVVRQGAGEVMVLSEVGARILEMLASGLDVAALLRALAGEYDVDPTTLERDVVAYLQELLDAEVIELAQVRAAGVDASAGPD